MVAPILFYYGFCIRFDTNQSQCVHIFRNSDKDKPDIIVIFNVDDYCIIGKPEKGAQNERETPYRVLNIQIWSIKETITSTI